MRAGLHRVMINRACTRIIFYLGTSVYYEVCSDNAAQLLVLFFQSKILYLARYIVVENIGT